LPATIKPLPASKVAEAEMPPPLPKFEVDPPRAAAIPPTTDDGAVVDIPSPLDMRHSLQQMHQSSDRELLALVDSGNRFDAGAARKVLAGRGYTEALLELTRQIKHLTAPQRLESLERTSTLPANEARLLLRWFLADEDGDVRYQALTTLATSGDPKMSELARRHAIEDADPRVADLAEKLLKRK
jgi:hypothetical protein